MRNFVSLLLGWVLAPFPDPFYGGHQLGRLVRHRKGAGSLADWLFLVFRCRFVVADFVSLASPWRAKLTHCIAPPLQREPAALGFALGAPFGGLFLSCFLKARLLAWWGSIAAQRDGVTWNGPCLP